MPCSAGPVGECPAWGLAAPTSSGSPSRRTTTREPRCTSPWSLGINLSGHGSDYGNAETGFAEEKMGPAIAEIRDKVFLVTKTEEPSYEGTWKLLKQSMKRMVTHRPDRPGSSTCTTSVMKSSGVTKSLSLVTAGPTAVLREAKRQDVVRFIGASGHVHPTRFHQALDSGEIDVLMNAVNFVDRAYLRLRAQDLEPSPAY